MRNEFTKALSAIATEMVREPLWKPLSEHYEARANSRSDQADKAAARIAGTAQAWPFKERKRFSIWLMNRSGRLREDFGHSRYRYRAVSSGRGIFEPREVIWSVVLPTLMKWRKEEPENPEPCFWLGLYDDRENPEPRLREAVRLDARHNPARAALVEHILKCIGDNQHELPSGYLGDPAEDLLGLIEAKALLAEVVEPHVRHPLEAHVSTLHANAEDWVTLRDGVRGSDWITRKSVWDARPPRQTPRNS